MAKTCFVSIDVEPDFDVSQELSGKKTGERRGFQGVEKLDKAIDILKRAGISATFFVTGQVFEAYPEKIKKWAEDEFEIACHSYSHRFWTKMSQQERKQDLEKFIALYSQVFGKKPSGFRAPSHLIDEKGLELLRSKGFLYDSSVLPHYPFFREYRGYQGKAPKVPYFPSPQNCRKNLQQPDRCKIYSGRVAEILEIPVAGQLGGIPLAGAWISRVPHWFYRVLFFFSRPQFITVSMHPWDALNFEGRHTSPQDFLKNLEKLLKLLKKRNYSFLKGKQIYEQFSKNSR